MPPKQKYRTNAKRILSSVPDCNIIVSTQHCMIDSIALVFYGVEVGDRVQQISRVYRLPGAMTAWCVNANACTKRNMY